MIIHTTWYGTFVLSRKGSQFEVVDFIGSDKDPGRIAEDLMSVSGGGLLDRERDLAGKYDIKEATEERIFGILENPSLVPAADVVVPGNDQRGYDISLLIEANTIRGSILSREEAADDNILSGVGALNDIESSLNIMIERIREWYSKSWPDISEYLDRREVLQAMASDPSPFNLLESMKGGPEYERLKGSCPDSDPAGSAGLATLAESALAMMGSRRNLEAYLEMEMERSAPNLNRVVGPLIGARLIHSASGLKRLALLPASTIQVLGAEKAFFRFLKEGGKPPKHGVLFQHPMVHSAKKGLRGRVARTMAATASLASRLDAYGGYDADRLKERMDRRIGEIRSSEVRKGGGKGGRQPPYRDGWWARLGDPKKSRKHFKRGRRK
ncbi:MAG: hypothetical protein ACMUIG_02615 [Thermoplasmatota archaeon]